RMQRICFIGCWFLTVCMRGERRTGQRMVSERGKKTVQGLSIAISSKSEIRRAFLTRSPVTVEKCVAALSYVSRQHISRTMVIAEEKSGEKLSFSGEPAFVGAACNIVPRFNSGG
ncbi:TPA: hypothetical protein ACXLFV_004928, partial [Salmonella enterica]